MITLLVGHRGVGKSSLLTRILHYFKSAELSVQCVDLDEEIAHREGRSIENIFLTEGEEFFRELERFQLSELVRTFENFKGEVFIALGAGFEAPSELIENLKKTCRILWVRRETDQFGRVFLNRPRLNSKVSALQEYLDRFSDRNERYSRMADWVLTLEEGVTSPNEVERSVFVGDARFRGASLTVLPSMLAHVNSISNLNSLKTKGFQYFELRDDLLTPEQMNAGAQALSGERLLVSYRLESQQSSTDEFVAENPNVVVDWPIERGAYSGESHAIGSLHSEEPIEDAIAQIDRAKGKYELRKLAITIHSWDDLLKGHKWWSADPKGRSFLPMSADGRWSWYRLWCGSQNPLNFLREGLGSAADQPTLLRWLSTFAGEPEFRKNGFAAVLGDPVLHSRTPVEQRDFFASLKMPVFAIRISQEEWSLALNVLRELGLRAAAVTSPLKELAFASCNETSDLAHMIQSVNTLVYKGGKWIGENTDLGGFKKIAVSSRDSAVIWGGGGTLKMTRLMVPNAFIYSAQTGQAREGSKSFPSSGSPSVLVWSVGRSYYSNGSAKWPPSHWRPKTVIDLNYTEDSPGLEYAASVGAQYISGLEMFREQARLQREFWSLHLNPPR